MPRQHLAALQGQRPGGAGTSQHTDCTQRQRQPESVRPFRVSFASQACVTASQQPAHTATTPASVGPGLRTSPGRAGLPVNVSADAVPGSAYSHTLSRRGRLPLSCTWEPAQNPDASEPSPQPRLQPFPACAAEGVRVPERRRAGLAGAQLHGETSVRTPAWPPAASGHSNN